MTLLPKKMPTHLAETTWRGPPLDLSRTPRTLMGALKKAGRDRGGSTIILQDHDGVAMSYDALIQAAYVLGGVIAKITAPRDTVGVLLPTCAPAVVIFFATHASGRLPAVLNHLTGSAHLGAACALAGVTNILTSRRFVNAAKLENVISTLESSISFIYIEDLSRSLNALGKAAALLRCLVSTFVRKQSKPNDPAVILFTSGTTGEPKGVVLSHASILANIAQCRARVPFDMDWIFFNVLPMFHAFGLTGGTLLPILGGMKTVLYPSPLDRSQIPEMIQATGANVLIATDTFAQLYARAAHEKTLAGLHYVVLGGERVAETTVQLFSEKSPAIILQGYGATECSPVIAVNHPETNRPGTVGKLLPGMEARLKPVPGVTAGERLFVRGPNVMAGYLNPDGGGFVRRQSDEWFDTGDLAKVDMDGFIIVTGRVSRFARIGAEMTSLAAVEDHAGLLWPMAKHAAVAIASDGGREMIVLVTDQHNAERADFSAWARARGVARVEIPQRIVVVRELPLLPTGKPDYPEIRRCVGEHIGEKNRAFYH